MGKRWRGGAEQVGAAGEFEVRAQALRGAVGLS